MSAYAFSEKVYQEAWCKKHNGIMEYNLQDGTRVDCLTDKFAVEFDFARKWAECAGQTVYYSYMTNKKGLAVLISNDFETDNKYFKRIEVLSEKFGFEVEYISDEILN